MTWFTLEQLGPESPVWRARASSGVVSSYVDSRGELRLWIEDGDPGGAIPALERVDPFPEYAITWPPDPAPREFDQVLDRVARFWTGSERELERKAGLPKAFLAKAKKGKRGGPRSVASWARLRSFLDALAA